MTRCECAEISFDEIARRMREKGLTLDQACERTGCGRTCYRLHPRPARPPRPDPLSGAAGSAACRIGNPG